MVKGLEKGNFRDHLLINTSQTTVWDQFVKEIENVEMARKNTKVTPMDLSAVGKGGQNKPFEGTCSWCGTYGHMARDCRKKKQYEEANGQWSAPTGGANQPWNSGPQARDPAKGKKGKGKGQDGGKGKFKSKKGKPGKGKGKGKKGLQEMEGPSPTASENWSIGVQETWAGTDWAGDEWLTESWNNSDWSAVDWSTAEWPDESNATVGSGNSSDPAVGKSLSMLGSLSLCELVSAPCGGQAGVKSVEAVTETSAGARTDKGRRTITFGVDTAACRTVIPPSHPATRGYVTHWDSESGVPYSTAGKSMVWDEGRRVLVAKQPSGEPIVIDSRAAQVRRPLMAVKPMTQQGHWVCFGPDRAFAYKPETGRVIPFEPTGSGWNLTMELEAPADANEKVQSAVEAMNSCERMDEESEMMRVGDVPSQVTRLIMGETEVNGRVHPFGWPGRSP